MDTCSNLFLGMCAVLGILIWSAYQAASAAAEAAKKLLDNEVVQDLAKEGALSWWESFWKD